MIPTRTKKKAIAADDMQWLFSCSFLGQVVPVRSFFQLLYVPGKNFLVKADRGYIYIFAVIPGVLKLLRGLSQSARNKYAAEHY